MNPLDPRAARSAIEPLGRGPGSNREHEGPSGRAVRNCWPSWLALETGHQRGASGRTALCALAPDHLARAWVSQRGRNAKRGTYREKEHTEQALPAPRRSCKSFWWVERSASSVCQSRSSRTARQVRRLLCTRSGICPCTKLTTQGKISLSLSLTSLAHY